MLCEEVDTLTESAQEPQLFEESMEKCYVLINHLKRMLQKYGMQILDVYFRKIPQFLDLVLQVMATVASYVDQPDIVPTDLTNDILVTSLTLLHDTLSMIKHLHEKSGKDDLLLKLQPVLEPEVNNAFKTMLLVKFPKAVIHYCINVLQMLSTFGRSLG